MRISKYILTFLLAGSIALFAFQAATKETPPEGGTPKDFVLPQRETFTLANGLQVVLVSYGIIPKASLQLTVKTGNIHENPEESGLCDLVGKFLEEGTAAHPAAEHAKAFAKMGGQLDIGVGMHTTTLAATVLSEFAPACAELIAETILQPAFPASETDRLKNDLKRDWAVQRTQPQNQAQEAFFQKIYGDHPYGRPLPEDAVVDAFTQEQARAYFDRQFGAARSTLYVAGKFDAATLRKAIETAFAAWQQGPAVAYPIAQAQMNNSIDLIERANSPQATLYFGLPVPDPTSPDYNALDVMDDILGGSFGSRITSNIREDKGYTYSPFSTVQNSIKNAVWYEQADVTIEHTGDAMVEVYKEIDRLRKEAPTEEELKGIQTYKAGIFVLQNSSPQGIIGQLNFMDLHGLPDTYLSNRIKDIYSVTPEQVQATTEKYLDPEKMLMVVVGDKKQTAPQMEAYKKADKTFKKVVD